MGASRRVRRKLKAKIGGGRMGGGRQSSGDSSLRLYCIRNRSDNTPVVVLSVQNDIYGEAKDRNGVLI